MYCIGFNGPPRSGKDTIARILHEEMEGAWGTFCQGISLKRSLSMPMRLVGFAMLGIPYSDEVYEHIKDEPHDVFNGETLRRFMIRYSEEFVKPAYGKAVWGRALISGIKQTLGLEVPGLLLIPDIGFQEETDELIGAFGPDNFLLAQLTREGTDWSLDSRGYVAAPNTFRWTNRNGEAEVLAADVITYAERMLGWEF